MTPALGSHEWLARFSLRLMQLRPELDDYTAIQRAVWCFGRCGFVEPEIAAQMYSEPAAAPRSSPSDEYRRQFDGTTGATSR